MLKSRLMLIACLAAAGCGGSSDSPPAASGGPAAAPAAGSRNVDACRLLTQEEIAAALGNTVTAGRPEAGLEVCDWDSESPTDADLLLMVRPKGSQREQVLCADVRNAAAAGKGLAGIGEAATWKFSSMGMFNSGELEVCDARAYWSLSVNGKGDSDTLQRAALTLARAAMGRL